MMMRIRVRLPLNHHNLMLQLKHLPSRDVAFPRYVQALTLEPTMLKLLRVNSSKKNNNLSKLWLLIKVSTFPRSTLIMLTEED